MIEFTCSRCDKQLKVQDKAAGKRGKCPECGAIAHVPDAYTRSVIEPEISQPTSKPDEGARASSADASDPQLEALGSERGGLMFPTVRAVSNSINRPRLRCVQAASGPD